MEPINLLFGFVLALMIILGSFEVKAGIKEKPPVLISMLPVWALIVNAAKKKHKANNCFILIH
jgi:hypothetical protein